MRATGTTDQFQKLGQCLRKSPRTKAFTAGLLANDDHSEPLSCLIRDISQDGAQIRVNAVQPVSEQGYMINLDTRSAYRVHAVWRRGSLTGLSLGTEYAIGDLLPANLEFLRSLFMEAKLRQVDQLIREGMTRPAALRKCGIAEKLNRRRSDVFSM